MTFQAESAHVPEVALASAFSDGDEVVGVPEGFAETFAKVPFDQEFVAGAGVELEEMAAEFNGVDTALGADAFVALEYLLAEVGRIGAEAPLVDAGVGAEGASPGGDFDATAAAQRPAVGSFGKFAAVDASAGLGALMRGHQ